GPQRPEALKPDVTCTPAARPRRPKAGPPRPEGVAGRRPQGLAWSPGVAGSGRHPAWASRRGRYGGFVGVVAGSQELKSLSPTMESIEAVLDLEKMRADIAVLEEQAAAPSLWDNPDEAQKITSKLSHLQAEVRKAEALRGRIDDLGVLFELAEAEDDPDTRAE